VGSPHIGSQLDESATYVAYITNAVVGPEGVAYGGEGFASLRRPVPARWASTQAGLPTLDAPDQLHRQLARLRVFTNPGASDGLVAARNVLANPALVQPPTLTFDDPALIFDSPGELDALLGQATRDATGARAGLEQWGRDNPTGVAHDDIGVVATGTMSIV